MVPVSAARPWVVGLAVILPAGVALALYLFTLAPTVATGDSGELTTVAATLAIAHPPGYPTFTLLGHLFTLLPVGDLAYRVNLMSAVLDATAVLLAGVIAGRLIDAARGRAGRADAPAWWSWAAAGVSAFALAISSAFWRYSLVAEVFALANLLAVALLLLMLEWGRRPGSFRYLWAAAIAAGLALTNQQTIVFTAPSMVILLGLGLQRFASEHHAGGAGALPWGAIGVALLLGIVSLLPYAYLPIAAGRGAPQIWGDPTTPGGFLGIISRSAYGTLSFTVRDVSGSILEHWSLFGGYLVSAFNPVGVVLAVLGGAWLTRWRPGEAAALGVWFLMAGPVFLALANPPLSDPVTRGVLERFYLLPSIPVGLLIGVGVWAIADRLRDALATRTRPSWAGGPPVFAVALLALVALATVRLPEVDQSRNHVADAYARDVLDSLPPNAFLLMRSDENYTSLLYAQEIDHLRPDVVAIDTELLKLDSYVSLLRNAHPDVVIPFARYDGGVTNHMADLIDNVIGLRPVYVVGEMEENLSLRLDLLDEGLVEHVLRDGTVPDALAFLRADPGLFARLHPPDKTWPSTTWEAAIAAHYADVAFKTGVALQQLGPQSNATEVEQLYREAIRISPTLASAYKNLGLALQTNGGPTAEVIAAWTHYLKLVPDDPEADAIRATIQRLGGSPSP